MAPHDDFDPLIYYYRSLRPGQQECVRAALVRRAHALRAQALRGMFRRLFSWVARRAAVDRLQTLDDHMLKDIGLHRSEIESAVRDGKPGRITPASARRPLPPVVEVTGKPAASPTRIAA
jgi:uncharacterized protein YjiS (DUF1127 family)